MMSADPPRQLASPSARDTRQLASPSARDTRRSSGSKVRDRCMFYLGLTGFVGSLFFLHFMLASDRAGRGPPPAAYNDVPEDHSRRIAALEAELHAAKEIVQRLLKGKTDEAGGGTTGEAGGVVQDTPKLKPKEQRKAKEGAEVQQQSGERKNATERRAERQKGYDPKKPMNVLLLYADDWRYDTLGVAGNPVVKTPTLDKLAREGVRFTENCVTTSVCWSSRVSMFTSMYLKRHKTYMPKIFNVTWEDTIYDLMQRGGYHVGHIGKWGVNHPHKQRPDFEVEEDGWHYTTRGTMKGPYRWHITEKNEADALRFLSTRPKDKPFFANVAFYATHALDGDKRQYLPQNKSMKMYDQDTVPNPVTNTMDAFNKLPYFFNDRNEGRTRWHWRYDEEEKRQTMMKNYYRMATEVDSACGLILEELRLQGELDNTLIIFTTDNGNYHAEHGLADKWYPHQESIRVPLIIKDPRMPKEKAGSLNVDFTLNIDLAPTMLGAAGIEAPKTMMGRDMSSLYLGSDKGKPSASATERYLTDPNSWRTEFFYEHPIILYKEYIPSSEALVRKDYKYFYWPDFGVEQLFHIESDPLEEIDLFNSTTNSTNSPQHQNVLKEMKARFAELKAVIHDEGRAVIL